MASASPYKGLRVLLAEPNGPHRRMITTSLTSLGCHPHAVPDGRAALAALERERFDLILIDIFMPVVDGLTAIRRLREHEKRSNLRRTPVYVLSSPDEHSNLLVARITGADGQLPKPLMVSRLLQAVEHANESRRPQSRARAWWRPGLPTQAAA
jgi:CheY-like chemotaxis protein